MNLYRYGALLEMSFLSSAKVTVLSLFLSLNPSTVGSIIFALKILNFVDTKLKLTF